MTPRQMAVHRVLNRIAVVAIIAALALLLGVRAAESQRTCFGRIPNIVGSGGDDFRFGGPGKDVMDGRRGDDTLVGLEGNDRICGRQGNDNLVGGDHFDRGDGGRGEDSCDVERRRNC